MTHRPLILSCEHGGARVPAAYRHLFASKAARTVLESHRGSDFGALRLARSLSLSLAAPLYASSVTRLLVDLNRSTGHPRLYSEFSKRLGPAERDALLQRHYFPHRDRVESWIERQAAAGSQVLHIGVHSFAPRVDGEQRSADVGLLYDPARSAERVFCARWKGGLSVLEPDLRVRRNYPYLGKSDGFVSYLRQQFAPRAYLGIELEVNQGLLGTRRGAQRASLFLAKSLAQLAGKSR